MKITSKLPISIYDVAEKEFTFDNLSRLYGFLGREAKFWRQQAKRFEEYEDSDRHQYFECVTRLEEIRAVINSWRSRSSEWSEEQFSQEIQNLQQSYDQFLRSEWLWSKHPYVETFIACNLEHGSEVAVAFINYVLYRDVSTTSGQGFIGTMLGYEFFYQDRHIESRRDGERKSLEILRDEMEEKVQQLENKIKFNTKRGENQNREQRKAFEELERLYGEDLQWREPAKHWKNTAMKHRHRGRKAARLLFAWISIGLAVLGYFVICWLQGIETQVDLDTWQGVVLFGSFMAVFAFSIRVLARLVFSSLHLARDAEEREQLTYLYLSLLEAEPTEKGSRDIVLRALFSRSQTGLLTHESGPHMLGEIMRTQQSN